MDKAPRLIAIENRLAKALKSNPHSNPTWDDVAYLVGALDAATAPLFKPAPEDE